jgi:ankyrin repeat protein
MNRPPLISAIIANNLSEVDFQIQSGTNINQTWDGFTPLEYAIKLKKKRVKIARLLIENHADISIYDNNSETVLEHLFVKFKNESAILSFLKSLPNIHVTDNYEKNTALHYAARYNYTRCIDYLLSKGANVNCVNSQRQSPVFFAVKRGHWQSLELLCQYGANLDIQDTAYKKHWSPIFYAISNSDHRCSELLINHGADSNHADYLGWTPLLYAIKNGNERIIYSLLERCNNIEYKVDIDDISASSLAKRSNSPAVRALVKSKIEQKILSSGVYADESAVSLCL